jgi:hypothetical protein
MSDHLLSPFHNNTHFPHSLSLSPTLAVSSLSFPRAYYGTGVIFLFPYPTPLLATPFSSLFIVFSLNQSHFIYFWYVVQIFGHQRADQNRERLTLIYFKRINCVLNLINMLKVAKIIFAILYTISICQRNKSCYF